MGHRVNLLPWSSRVRLLEAALPAPHPFLSPGGRHTEADDVRSRCRPLYLRPGVGIARFRTNRTAQDRRRGPQGGRRGSSYPAISSERGSWRPCPPQERRRRWRFPAWGSRRDRRSTRRDADHRQEGWHMHWPSCRAGPGTVWVVSPPSRCWFGVRVVRRPGAELLRYHPRSRPPRWVGSGERRAAYSQPPARPVPSGHLGAPPARVDRAFEGSVMERVASRVNHMNRRSFGRTRERQHSALRRLAAVESGDPEKSAWSKPVAAS